MDSVDTFGRVHDDRVHVPHKAEPQYDAGSSPNRESEYCTVKFPRKHTMDARIPAPMDEMITLF